MDHGTEATFQTSAAVRGTCRTRRRPPQAGGRSRLRQEQVSLVSASPALVKSSPTEPSGISHHTSPEPWAPRERCPEARPRPLQREAELETACPWLGCRVRSVVKAQAAPTRRRVDATGDAEGGAVAARAPQGHQCSALLSRGLPGSWANATPLQTQRFTPGAGPWRWHPTWVFQIQVPEIVPGGTAAHGPVPGPCHPRGRPGRSSRLPAPTQPSPATVATWEEPVDGRSPSPAL